MTLREQQQLADDIKRQEQTKLEIKALIFEHIKNKNIEELMRIHTYIKKNN